MGSFRVSALILLSALAAAPAPAPTPHPPCPTPLPPPPHPHHRALPRRWPIRRAGAAHWRQDERRFSAAGGGREPAWGQYGDRGGGGGEGLARRLHAVDGDRFDA